MTWSEWKELLWDFGTSLFIPAMLGLWIIVAAVLTVRDFVWKRI